MRELIGRFEKAGLEFVGDREYMEKFLGPGGMEKEVLAAPMVLSPDVEEMAEEKCLKVPDVVKWDGWDGMGKFRRVEGGAALDGGVVVRLRFVERTWLVKDHLGKVL